MIKINSRDCFCLLATIVRVDVARRHWTRHGNTGWVFLHTSSFTVVQSHWWRLRSLTRIMFIAIIMLLYYKSYSVHPAVELLLLTLHPISVCVRIYSPLCSSKTLRNTKQRPFSPQQWVKVMRSGHLRVIRRWSRTQTSHYELLLWPTVEYMKAHIWWISLFNL